MFKGYEPKVVFDYFKEISGIPRCSGMEKNISDYFVEFAKKNDLFVYQDESNNILIRKPASKGYEGYKSICLQGHLDMVCDKNKGVEFDFENCGIDIKVEDGFIKGNGTTLGADNGICLAMCMAILEDKSLKHPKLEILLTTDEEVGMSGATNFDVHMLESDILVNIDSEQYGVIYVSSAGCSATLSTLEYKATEEVKNVYEIELLGLRGGHSGADIHENTANANNLLASILQKLAYTEDVEIVNFNGGNKNNTIPREASCVISTSLNQEALDKMLGYIFESSAYKYEHTEVLENMKLEVKKVDSLDEKALSKEDTHKLLAYIVNHMTGVVTMSQDIKGLVETSLNVGIVETVVSGNNKQFTFNVLTRSAKTKAQRDVVNYIEKYTTSFGGKFEILDFCNPWEYKKDSKVREYFAKVFEEQNGVKPEILAIHAGLECGIFAESRDDLDIISIGPDIKYPHTPDEKMSIEAVSNTWDYLLKILEGYKID